MADKEMAIIARSLALMLKHFARDRRDEDRKAIAQLHTDLVRAFEVELEQIRAQQNAPFTVNPQAQENEPDE